jgi:type IV secretory pathway TrbD component
MNYERRSTPIHKSLHEVKSTWGAEFVPTIANVALLGVMVMGPRFYWWPVVTIAAQQVLKWLFSRDPQMSLVFSKYMREGDTYDPWPRPNNRNKRPVGAGRDIPLC